MVETTLVWLRNDLRISDNPALAAGMARGRADEIVELVRGLERLASLDDLTGRLISVA